MTSVPLAELIHQAQRLVDELGDVVSRETSAFAEGYRAAWKTAFELGDETGYRRAMEENAESWARACSGSAKWGRLPDYCELEMIRWGGPREQFGNPRPGDFPGMKGRK